ncbi:MAG: hypothetical protein ACRDIC_15050 [bacterium]
MKVKSIVVLVLVLALVAGIAVNGSRAQPLTVTSTAFQQCVGQTAGAAPCEPLLRPLVAQTEFEAVGARDDAAGATAEMAAGAGAEVGESRSAWWIGLAFLAWEVAQYFLERRPDRGSYHRGPAVVAETVFDPAR